MTTAEDALRQSLSSGADVRQIEPGVFSVAATESLGNVYDTDFGNIYEWVACNPLYNRIMWGYSTSRYATFSAEAICSTTKGPILDLACGSLAFTASTYLQYPEHVLICSDQSLKMLKMAKARLHRIRGTMPDHVVFLLADARCLPFRTNSIGCVLCLNLLHCLSDVPAFLQSLSRFVEEGSKLHFTTLVQGNRLSDRYLAALARSHKLVSRSISEVTNAFHQAGYQVAQEVSGNLAFLKATSANQRCSRPVTLASP